MKAAKNAVNTPFIVSVSAVALCLSAGLVLTALPAFAQSYSGHVDANGMPTDHSTPAERAQTRALNNQVQSGNEAIDQKAAQQKARYDAQRAQYEQQQARYHDAMQRHEKQQSDYRARHTAYEDARAHYNAEYGERRRHAWPDHGRWVVIDRDINPVGERVELINGQRVGTVIDVMRGPGGHVQALKLRLDRGRLVWIDADDVRFNRDGRVLATDLDRQDLWEMAGGRP